MYYLGIVIKLWKYIPPGQEYSKPTGGKKNRRWRSSSLHQRCPFFRIAYYSIANIVFTMKVSQVVQFALTCMLIATAAVGKASSSSEECGESKYVVAPRDDGVNDILYMVARVSPTFGKPVKAHIEFDDKLQTIVSKEFVDDNGKGYIGEDYIHKRVFVDEDVAAFCFYVERVKDEGEICGAGVVLKDGVVLKESVVVLDCFPTEGALMLCASYRRHHEKSAAIAVADADAALPENNRKLQESASNATSTAESNTYDPFSYQPTYTPMGHLSTSDTKIPTNKPTVTPSSFDTQTPANAPQTPADAPNTESEKEAFIKFWVFFIFVMSIVFWFSMKKFRQFHRHLRSNPTPPVNRPLNLKQGLCRVKPTAPVMTSSFR